MIRNTLILALIGLAICSQIISEQSLAVTIYNNNFAMVKDVRKISFDQGQSTLYFTDVASNIQTQTVTFKAIKNPKSIRIYEQNFERNLINSEGILKRYLEKDIDLYVQLGTSSRRVSGKLLGYNSGYIIQTSNGIQIFNKIAGVEFPTLPQGFFTRPTLNWKVFSEVAQVTPCQVAYRTTGFRWVADYSLTLNEQQTEADLGGWVTIDNNSGKKYVDANLKLIAGDVNTVKPNFTQPVFMSVARLGSAAGGGAPSFSQKSFADYHLYTLSKPVTLNESSQKQVQFVPKAYNISIQKYHQIKINAGGFNQQNINARNFVKFLNSQQNGLGIPFPKGTVRVFKQDKDDGSLEFIGQDSIKHTPKEQNITINTGNAFDIVSNKIAKNRTNTDTKGGYSAELSLTVANRKQIKADVVILLSNQYRDNLRIKMLTDDPAPQKISASQYRWSKTLEPNQIWQLNWTQNYFA